MELDTLFVDSDVDDLNVDPGLDEEDDEDTKAWQVLADAARQRARELTAAAPMPVETLVSILRKEGLLVHAENWVKTHIDEGDRDQRLIDELIEILNEGGPSLMTTSERAGSSCIHHRSPRRRHVHAPSDDLYEVCGQTQKSVHWKGDRERLFEHLGQRAARAQQQGWDRFERGDQALLATIARQARFLEPEFVIHIVQPGVSRQNITDAQKDLLATTRLRLLWVHTKR